MLTDFTKRIIRKFRTYEFSQGVYNNPKYWPAIAGMLNISFSNLLDYLIELDEEDMYDE